MIVVTGGAGFIGSALVWQLNEAGIDDIVVVDRLGTGEKWKNLVKRNYHYPIHKDNFLQWLNEKSPKIEAIFHMGASSTTMENDADYLMQNNLHYSMQLFTFATERNIPFIYASSAATYGAREGQFVDAENEVKNLRPINKYGYSKQLFDQWVLKQKMRPRFWAGLKFFNVYGPQEYHKEGQASVVFHAYPQVKNSGSLRLFKSYRQDLGNGEQKRDFVYVKDVVKVIYHLYTDKNAQPGIYNVGTGRAQSFIELGNAVFKAIDSDKPNFEWIDMPPMLRNQYQYFTEADLHKLREKGRYTGEFLSLEEGVKDYVKNYLCSVDPYF